MPTSILVEKKKLAKPPLDIHYLGDRVLRQPAKRITTVDDALRGTIVAMLQTMYSSDGIGLAAPQVGIHKQLIVIDCEFEDPKAPPLILINPAIKSYGKAICKDQEGCLSIPGVYLDVERPETIEIASQSDPTRIGSSQRSLICRSRRERTRPDGGTKEKRFLPPTCQTHQSRSIIHVYPQNWFMLVGCFCFGDRRSRFGV
jgi:peptide deformylase